VNRPGGAPTDAVGLGVPAPPLPVLDAPWTIRTLRADGDDLDLVHRWMNAPHVATAWHQDWPRERWAGELRRQLAGAHSRPCLVSRDGVPFAYVELYRVVRDRLAAYFPARPHDLGVHLAIGAAENTGRGRGGELIRVIAAGLLAADPACTRVVAEPNVDNARSVRAFARAGFRPAGQIELPHKTAVLLVRTRTATDPAASAGA